MPISFSCVPARIPCQRQKYNVTVWATVFDSAFFDKTHLLHQPQALVILASDRHDNLFHLAHVERVIKYRRQVFRREPAFNSNVAPDARVVPVLVDNTGNDLATLKPDCLTAFCKVSTANTFRNPFPNLVSFDNLTQSIPPTSKTRSVATHCNAIP